MPTASIRSMAQPSPADRSGFANHNARITPQICKTSAAPDQRQDHHGGGQQPDEPDHDGAHSVRRGPQRNRIGIVRPNALHEDLSPGHAMMLVLGRGSGPASSKASINGTAARRSGGGGDNFIPGAEATSAVAYAV